MSSTKLELVSEGDEALCQHPKRRKSTNHSEFPSTSMKDSIPSLPTELITEILVRVPVKPLLKFRCVSKSWLALISSPEFVKAHLNLSVGTNNKEDTHHILIEGTGDCKWTFKECTLRYLLDECITEAFDLDYPIKKASEKLHVVGSCNGLIFLSHYSKRLFLWNPTIRKCKKLPDFKPKLKKNIYTMYGFGYDELRDDYKVVGVCYSLDCSDYVEVKIYSLKSNSWTTVDYCGDIVNASSSSREMTLLDSGLFVNGKLHWDTISRGPFVRKGTTIISFDLADEKWEKVDKPSFGIGDTELFVGEFGSGLSVFSDYKGTQFDVWLMKEYGVKESWMKMFTIRYPNHQTLYPPFFMSNKGEILAALGSTFMIYNSKNHSFKHSKVVDGCFGLEIYVESLVCPFSIEGTENSTKRLSRVRKLRSKQRSSK